MSNTPPQFVAALASLRRVARPDSLTFREIPAPQRLAPYSAAVAIQTVQEHGGQPLGQSTFVILYDPEQAEIWGSPLRLVGQLRTQIDEEMSSDPLLGEVLWLGLRDELGEAAELLLGTVTREISQTFGGLELRSSTLNIELRCSWSPVQDDLAPHLEAWGNYLLQVAAIPSENYLGFEVHDA
ncbi:DUF3000 family protein [Scrofimicrobium sp. R131]|uniref:DUF3000 family protein n=1 Tax=Scrofimicrobium appendicitidis TaxID=3079930 RepID=A0AAU7V5B6_9ACTO